jgi:hypothetical protein
VDEPPLKSVWVTLGKIESVHETNGLISVSLSEPATVRVGDVWDAIRIPEGRWLGRVEVVDRNKDHAVVRLKARGPNAKASDELRVGDVVVRLTQDSNGPPSHTAKPDGRQLLKDVQEFQKQFMELERLVAVQRQRVNESKAALDDGTFTQAIVATHQKDLELAEKRLRLVRDEYDAQLRLLDSEVRIAKKTAELAKIEYSKAVRANELLAGTVLGTELQRLKGAAELAELHVERAETLLDLYRKVAPVPEKQ